MVCLVSGYWLRSRAVGSCSGGPRRSDNAARRKALKPNNNRRSGLQLQSGSCQGILTAVSVLDLRKLPTNPLDALRELSQCETELGRLRRGAIEAARQVGATWDQVGAALGMSRQAAWEYYTRAIRERLDQSVAAGKELSDDDAMELAVDEVQAARRERRRA